MSSADDPRTKIRHPSYHADAGQGSLRRTDGTRVSTLSLEWVHELHATLVAQFEDNAADVLYRSGYEWGLQDMVGLNHRLRQEIGGAFDLWQTDAKFALESWWAPLAEAGWGNCTFELLGGARGIVLIDLRSSIVAAALQEAEEPVCHLYAGLFAGVLSFFERTERHSTEIQCAAMGAASCRFIVGSGPDIDSAEGSRQQGHAAAEIVRRLR